MTGYLAQYSSSNRLFDTLSEAVSDQLRRIAVGPESERDALLRIGGLTVLQYAPYAKASGSARFAVFSPVAAFKITDLPSVITRGAEGKP